MNLFIPVLRVATALTVTLIFTHTASAEIYKWIDTQGRTHYTQTPPPAKEVKKEDVKNIVDDIEMVTGKLGTAFAKEKLDNAAATDEKDELADAREEGEKNNVKHKTFCDQQKAALKQLLANPIIRWKSDGEERILTAAERKSKIDEFTGNVKEMCNDKVLDQKAAADQE